MEFTPELFFAKGDGQTDDTTAFQHLAVAIQTNGGGIVILKCGAVYMVGRQSRQSELAAVPKELQQPPFDALFVAHKIFEVKKCTKPVIVHGNGATVRCNPELRYGAFDPTETPIPPNPCDPSGFAAVPPDANRAFRYHQLFLFEDCDSVSIDNLTFDGNEASAIAGGPIFGPAQWELPDHGLQLLNCGEFRLVNVESKGNFADGLMVRGKATRASVVSRGTPGTLINVHLHGNGRNGLSYLAGVGLAATDCRFNENGRTESGPRAAPAAGVDIEPELKRGAAARRATFISCEFLDNAGSGLAAGAAQSIDDVRFINCEFGGYGGPPLKLGASGLVFDQCKILGSAPNSPSGDTQFRNCTFEDRDHPTFGASNRQMVSLVRSPRSGDKTQFTDCRFIANQLLALRMDSRTSRSEFRNCEVLLRNHAGLPESAVSRIQTVVFDDMAFRDDFAPNLRLQTVAPFDGTEVEFDLGNLRPFFCGHAFGFQGDWDPGIGYTVYQTVLAGDKTESPDRLLYESRSGSQEFPIKGRDPTKPENFRFWHPLLKQGDLMLVRLFVPGLARDIKPPNAGWQEILDTVDLGGDLEARAVLFRKIVNTSNPADPNFDDFGQPLLFTLPGPVNGEAQFVAFFGVDQTTPVAGAAEQTAAGTSSATAPGFTLTVPGATLVWLGAVSDPAEFSRFSLPTSPTPLPSPKTAADWREESNGSRTGIRTLYRVKAGSIDSQEAIAFSELGTASKQAHVNAQMVAVSPPHATASDGEMTAGSTTLISAALAFTPEDVGRQIAVVGAADPADPVLSSVIVSVANASEVELADKASVTVSGAEVNLVRYPNEHHIALLEPRPEIAGRGVKTEGPSVRWGKNGPTDIQISGFESGSVVLGRKTLPTNTTKGFTYLPTTAGPPTGTPDAQGDTAPIVYDTLGNSLWIYHGTWCRVPCQDPAQFEPTELAGCQHWYRADRGANVVGGALASWENQGLAAGATFSQSATSMRPTVVVDPQFGVASIVFDGTNDFLESNLPADDWKLLHNGHANDGVTVLTVFHSAAEVQNQVLLQTSRNSSVARTGASYRYRTDPQQAGLIAFEVNDGVSQTRVVEANTGKGSVSLGKVHSLATRFRSGLFDLYVDLVQSLSGSPTGSATGAPFGTARISSQSGPGSAAQFIDGHFFELIVYDRFLDDGELATVHGYLNARYKITS